MVGSAYRSRVSSRPERYQQQGEGDLPSDFTGSWTEFSKVNTEAMITVLKDTFKE